MAKPNDLKDEIEKNLDRMRTLRDEIRVRVHLGGLDAKDEWRKIEPRLARVEASASELTEATKAALREVVERLTKLRKHLS